MEDARPLHVALLPGPGLGHLIPFLELASRLFLRHNLSSTLLVNHANIDEPLLRQLPDFVSASHLPAVPPMDDLPATVDMVARLCLSTARNLPAIGSVLSGLKGSRELRLVALVVDMFSADAIDVARELRVPCYIFYTSCATNLSLFLHLPALHGRIPCAFRDFPEPIRIPGCVSLRGDELPSTFQDRADEGYKLLVSQCRKYHESDGIIVNSFCGIEPGPCRTLLLQTTATPGRPPVYPVGPLIRNSDPTGVQDDILQWLDGQPTGSVLYVSFGSGGVLSQEQTAEIAAGLEMSQQRFLWVVRVPGKGSADANYLGIRRDANPLEFLPEGFLERTREVGLVVPNWAPQVQILAHTATGGFMTHCGWNSTLESVMHRVPMAAWPLYADQKLAAAVLVGGVGLAIRIRGAGWELVGREEVSRVARKLMEGEEGKEARRKVAGVEEAARATLASGGESSQALEELVRRWKV